MGNQTCNLRTCRCTEGHTCSTADDCRLPALVAEVKDDLTRHRTREFLQFLEARKLEADPIELAYILVLEAHLKSVLDDEPPVRFHDFREGARRSQLYETRQEWDALRYYRGRD